MIETTGETKTTGGLAFPGLGFPGMTLRDWFAGQAVQGLTLAMKWPAPSAGWPKALAESAYQIADAMLVERVEEQL
jgi:hypothetical protein